MEHQGCWGRRTTTLRKHGSIVKLAFCRDGCLWMASRSSLGFTSTNANFCDLRVCMQVLLSPMKYALQHSNSQAVRLAAVGSWARLMLLLLGQRQLLPLLDDPAVADAGGAAAGATGTGVAINNGASNSSAGGLHDGLQQQQQAAGCEGLSLQALQAFLQPMVETILGCAEEVPAAAEGDRKTGGGSGRGKQQQKDRGSSCLAATPVVQFVLQQVVHTLSAAAAAPEEQEQQQQQVATELPPLVVLLCRIMQRAVCSSADAVSVKAAAAAAFAGEVLLPNALAAPSAADATPSPGAAAAAADAHKNSTVSCEQAKAQPSAAAAAAREATPPPCTPVHGRLAAVPGGLWGSALKPQAGGGPGSAFKQGMGWLQLVTPPVNSRLTPPTAATPAAAAAGDPPSELVGAAANPVRVLHNLPGWLQLLLETLQLLLLPVPCSQAVACSAEGEGSGEQQLQLVQREWLPAWVGAMDQLGAATLLLQQQSHAHSNSGSSGSRSKKQQHQQQQLVTGAVGATVQCVMTLQECMKVSAVLVGRLCCRFCACSFGPLKLPPPCPHCCTTQHIFALMHPSLSPLAIYITPNNGFTPDPPHCIAALAPSRQHSSSQHPTPDHHSCTPQLATAAAGRQLLGPPAATTAKAAAAAAAAAAPACVSVISSSCCAVWGDRQWAQLQQQQHSNNQAAAVCGWHCVGCSCGQGCCWQASVAELCAGVGAVPGQFAPCCCCC